MGLAFAAENWTLSVADWSSWNRPSSNQWQVPSWMGIAFACGYYDFYEYLSENERDHPK